ncbi:MAG: MFS transporter [Candidatus Odinarchaeota archaeon]
MTDLVDYQEQTQVNAGLFVKSAPRIVLTFMIIQFVGLFMYGGFRTVYPIILEFSFNFTEQEVISSWAIIYSIGLIIAFSTRIPMGIIADRYSRLRSLSFGSLLCIASLVGTLYTKNIFVLALLFGLLRTGVHIFPLVSRGYVGETNPARQGRLNGLILLAGNTGSLLGPILLATLLEISLPWLIWLSCGILLVNNLLFALNVPPGSKSTIMTLKSRLWISIAEIWKLKTIVLVFTVSGVVNGINETVQVPYAHYALGLTPAETGFFVGLVQLSSIIIIFISGESIDKFGVNNLIILGTGLEAIAGMLFLLATKNLLIFFISQILLQGGILVIITASVTAITLKVSRSTVSRSTISTSFGIATSFFFLGSALVPYIAGELYLVDARFPYLAIFMICILVILLYCLSFIREKLKN